MAKKELSIEDSLKSALKQVSEEETETEAASPAPEPQEDVAEPEVEAVEEAETEEPTSEESSEVAPEASVEEEEDEWEAPKCLSEDERNEFKSLPKDLKPFADKFVRRRDLSFQRWVNKVRGEADAYVQEAISPFQSITQVLEPHAQRLQLDGKSIATTLESQLAWDQLISEQPLEGLSQLLRRTGVTPRDLYDYMSGEASGEAQPQASGSHDPRLDTVLEKLERLEGENAKLAERNVRSQWAGVVNQIAAARYENGEPAYPYYEDVRQEMAQWTRLIGVQEPNLNPQQLFHKAYEKACWSNDSIRSILLNERQATKAAAGLKKKQAALSLPASSSNGVTAKVAKTPHSKDYSIEESLRDALTAHGVEF